MGYGEICPLKSKFNFWNRLTFSNKKLILLGSFQEPELPELPEPELEIPFQPTDPKKKNKTKKQKQRQQQQKKKQKKQKQKNQKLIL